MPAALRLLFTLGFLLVSVTSAQAAFVFSAHLTGAQEVPANASLAFGDAQLVLNDSQDALSYFITVNGLDFTGTQSATSGDNLVAAHIHASATSVPGVNARVVFGIFGAPLSDINPNDVVTTPFTNGVGGTISGKWDANEGNNTTLPAQLENLLAGRAYFNFHTTQFSGGEIRGQILQVQAPVQVPEPGTLGLLTAGLAGLGLARRRRQS